MVLASHATVKDRHGLCVVGRPEFNVLEELRPQALNAQRTICRARLDLGIVRAAVPARRTCSFGLLGVLPRIIPPEDVISNFPNDGKLLRDLKMQRHLDLCELCHHQKVANHSPSREWVARTGMSGNSTAYPSQRFRRE